MNIIETIGSWWFPHLQHESNGENYVGTLKQEGNKIILTLIGCDVINAFSVKLIHGMSTDGKSYTLYEANVTSRSIGMPGIATITFSIKYCLKGEWLTLDELAFNSASISSSNLKYWFNISGFDNYQNSQELTSIEYRIPDPIVFYEKDNIKFVILFIRETQIFRPKHEFNINQSTKILIKQEGGMFDFENLWEYIFSIKSFFTLSYFSQAAVQSIQLKRDNTKLELYHSWLEDEIEDKKVRTDFLFTYQQVEHNFLSIFNNWVNLNTTIKPVINILEETFGNKNIILENRFLNVIQGIETFHRRLRNNEKILPTEYKSKVDSIVSTTPAEHAKWLKEKLSFANEPTLNERLDDLFAEIPVALLNHLFPNFKQIIKDTKNSRNYYTHYNHKLESKALKNIKLFYLTEKLKVFLLIILLKEIGFNETDLSSIIKESSYFLFNHLILNEGKRIAE